MYRLYGLMATTLQQLQEPDTSGAPAPNLAPQADDLPF